MNTTKTHARRGPAQPNTSSTTSSAWTGNGRGRSNRQIDGLSGIELTSASALNDYLSRLAGIANALAFELEMASRDLEVALANMPGMRLFGAQGRVKARIVTRHMKAAAAAAAFIRTAAGRTKASYMKHFGDAVQRPGRGKQFDPYR